MRKLVCALAALVCLSSAPSYAQETEAEGLEGLAELVAALQSIIAALNALGGGFNAPPPMSPPAPPDMPPIDPNDFKPPPPPTRIDCELLFTRVVDFGEVPFLAAGETIPGFVETLQYPDDTEISARLNPELLCDRPGVRLRVVRVPETPLVFKNVPSPGTKDNEIGLTAGDSRMRGECRPGAPAAELDGFGSIECTSLGIVQFIFGEVTIQEGPNMWPTTIGTMVETSVRLTVNTPSRSLLAFLGARI